MIRIVTTAAELAGLKTQWEALCEKLGDEASAFSSFAWYETWWRHYGDAGSLYVVTLWEAETLVGIAPLMLRRVTIHGLSATALCFLENNQSLNNDLVVLPEAREALLNELLGHAFKNRSEWDVLVLKNLPEGSPTLPLLQTLLDREGMKWRETPTWFDSPYLVPAGSWCDYLAGRSTRTRKSLRNIANGMQRAGVAEVRQIGNWNDLLKVKDEIFHVARSSWAGTSGDRLTSADGESFLQDWLRAMAEQGWLSTWTLALDGKMIAVEFHARAYGKEHAMRGHYLPEYASLSPGTYLEMQILQHVFEEEQRLRIYDFCGSFEEYKKKWTSSFVAHRDVTVFNKGIYGPLLRFHETVTVPALKRLFPQQFWNNRFFRMCGINPNRMGGR